MANRYTNAKTGETAKGKSSFTVEDRVPPYIPINWMDWEGDEHVQDMDEVMEGIYFRVVKELWKFDRFEFNYTRLAKRIRVQDARRVRSFLERFGHLFNCVKCKGVPEPCWEHAATVQDGCSDLAEGLQRSCRYCAEPSHCTCSGLAVFVQHIKLRNYKNDVKNGLPLGTTKPNLIVQNLTEANQIHDSSEQSDEIQFLSESNGKTSTAFDLEEDDELA
jgi:hypothetical protein